MSEPAPPGLAYAYFPEALRRYLANADVLAEIHRSLPALFGESDERDPFGSLEEAAAYLDPEKRSKFIEAHDALFREAALIEENGENKDRGDESDGATVGIRITDRGGRPTGKIAQIVVDDDEIAEALNEFLTELAVEVSRPTRRQIFLQSLVVMGFSALEVLVAQIMSAFFRRHEGALGTDRPEFSLDELRLLGSIDDAVELAINNRVDNVLADGFSEWQNWFKKYGDVDFEKIALHWSLLYEVIQRRHVIVHYGGRASRAYLTRVGTDDIQVGTQLEIDDAYVDSALDELEIFGARLAIFTWMRVAGDEVGGAARALMSRINRLAASERWQPARALAEFGEKLKVDEPERLLFRVAAWHARKQLNDAAVDSEVRAWDVRALRRDFALMKACLLDNLDEAITLVPSALAGGLSTRRLRSLAVFSDLRHHPAYRDVDPVGATGIAQEETGRG